MEEIKSKENTRLSDLTFVFVALGLLLMIFNQFQIASLDVNDSQSGSSGAPTGLSVAEASDVIPTGVPKIYGGELNLKYDDVNVNDARLADETIAVMSNFDKEIILQGNELERYIDILSEISCEYCCGAQSVIVRRDEVAKMNSQIAAAIKSGQLTEEDAAQYRKTAGDSACGCAHSYAMRGLTKYLLTQHGEEFTNEEVLEEVAKWKTLYFPGQMVAKAAVLKEKGIPFSYTNLGSNKYRDIEKGTSASSGMVGGC